MTRLSTLGKTYSVSFLLKLRSLNEKKLTNVIGFIRNEGKFKGLFYVSILPTKKNIRGVS